MPSIFELSATDPRTTLVLNNFVETAPIVRDLNAQSAFYTAEGSADTLREGRDGTVSDIFRSINSDNNPSAANVTYVTGDKKIVSFSASVDKINEQRGSDIDSELAYETAQKAEDAGYAFQTAMFEGDSGQDADSFDGFRALCKSANVESPPSKLVLPIGGDSKRAEQMEFFEYLFNWMEAIPGGAEYLYCNNKLRNRMLMAAKNIGYYRQTKDALDQRVEMIGDVIVRGAGHKADGSLNLPFNETFNDGTTHNDTSSLFAVRYGTRRQVTMLTSNGGCLVDFDDNYGTNHIAHHVNMDSAPILQEPDALQQLEGVGLSA